MLWILLLCFESFPQMPSCSANIANMDKNNFDIFYKIDCCAAIHGQISMNNVPNESRIIMLSCTKISFVIYFFEFEKVGVKLGFPFFYNSHCIWNHSLWHACTCISISNNCYMVCKFSRYTGTWQFFLFIPCFPCMCSFRQFQLVWQDMKYDFLAILDTSAEYYIVFCTVEVTEWIYFVFWLLCMAVLGQLPTGDNSPPDKNKAQLLPTRTTIPRTTSH